MGGEARLGSYVSNLAHRTFYLFIDFHCENADRPWRPPPGLAASGSLGSDPAATCPRFHRENADRPSPLPREKVAGCGNAHLFDLPYCSFASTVLYALNSMCIRYGCKRERLSD